MTKHMGKMIHLYSLKVLKIKIALNLDASILLDFAKMEALSILLDPIQEKDDTKMTGLIS